jgi:membrane protein implicated in regulation of membrane protease activity
VVRFKIYPEHFLEMMKSKEASSLMRRYIKAYLSLLGIVAAFISVSMAQGAGWKPALAGMPLYVILFVAITYRLVREIVASRRRERNHGSVGDDGH